MLYLALAAPAWACAPAIVTVESDPPAGARRPGPAAGPETCVAVSTMRWASEAQALVTLSENRDLRQLHLWDWRRARSHVVASGDGYDTARPGPSFALSSDGRWLAWVAAAAYGEGDVLFIDDLETEARVFAQAQVGLFGRPVHDDPGRLWFVDVGAGPTLIHQRHDLSVWVVELPSATQREVSEGLLDGSVVTRPDGAWIVREDELVGLFDGERRPLPPRPMSTHTVAVGPDMTLARVVELDFGPALELRFPDGRSAQHPLDDALGWLAVRASELVLTHRGGGVERWSFTGQRLAALRTRPLHAFGVLRDDLYALVDDAGLALVRASDGDHLRMCDSGRLGQEHPAISLVWEEAASGDSRAVTVEAPAGASLDAFFAGQTCPW